ncbi:MAG TPA: hypothetical protein VJO33_02800, partial [Gemmatimonadaceae bacterium]|nr:hypothetical protein [Gemmatimonadaceae bacterium]
SAATPRTWQFRVNTIGQYEIVDEQGGAVRTLIDTAGTFYTFGGATLAGPTGTFQVRIVDATGTGNRLRLAVNTTQAAIEAVNNAESNYAPLALNASAINTAQTTSFVVGVEPGGGALLRVGGPTYIKGSLSLGGGSFAGGLLFTNGSGAGWAWVLSVQQDTVGFYDSGGAPMLVANKPGNVINLNLPTCLTGALSTTSTADFGSYVVIRGTNNTNSNLIVCGDAVNSARLLVGNFSAYVEMMFTAADNATPRNVDFTAAGYQFNGGAVVIPTAAGLWLTTPFTPATSAAAGTKGQFAWDANFLYICVATNSWRRSTLFSF